MSTASMKLQLDNAELRVGKTLKDKWRLDAVIGVGGMASVYAATHRNGKKVAIKVLHAELVSNPDVAARFLREGYVANKLDHPGAVSILDDDRLDDGSIFLVMELLEGYSLDKHTRRGEGRLSLEKILRIGVDVLDVLGAAHAHGVIHRDIKPANIFLLKDGRVKLLDFGIARLAEPIGDGAMSTQTGTAIGTPAFMPPEQARGRWSLLDARTDIWALGATLYALILGERPRRAHTMQEEMLMAMALPMPRLESRAPHVQSDVAAIIDRAIEFEMDARWPDARAMQESIRTVLARGIVEKEPPPSSTRLEDDAAAEEATALQRAAAAVMTTGRPITAGSKVPTSARGARAVGRGSVMLAVGIGVSAIGLGLAARILVPRSPAGTSVAAAPDLPPAPTAQQAVPGHDVSPAAAALPPSAASAARTGVADGTPSITGPGAPGSSAVAAPAQRPGAPSGRTAAATPAARPAPAVSSGAKRAAPSDDPFDSRFSP